MGGQLAATLAGASPVQVYGPPERGRLEVPARPGPAGCPRAGRAAPGRGLSGLPPAQGRAAECRGWTTERWL